MAVTAGPYRPPSPPPPSLAAAGVRARVPELVLAVIGAGALAVVALWWHDTPAVHGWPAGTPRAAVTR